MKANRKVRRDAKRLLRLCRPQGRLDDVLVRQVVRQVAESPLRSRLPLLAQFRRLLAVDIARRSATVESAVPMSPALQELLARSLGDLHGPGLSLAFIDRPNLLAGLRVTVGSTVYDGSLHGALLSLEERL